MTRTDSSAAAQESRSLDDDARVARRRRLLDQVDEALRRARGVEVQDPDWSFVATTLARVRSELRRDLSVADVDAATEPHFAVVPRSRRER